MDPHTVTAKVMEVRDFAGRLNCATAVVRVQMSQDVKNAILDECHGNVPIALGGPEGLGPTEPGTGMVRVIFADYVVRVDGGLEGPADRPLERAVQNALPRSRKEKLQDKRRQERGYFKKP